MYVSYTTETELVDYLNYLLRDIPAFPTHSHLKFAELFKHNKEKFWPVPYIDGLDKTREHFFEKYKNPFIVGTVHFLTTNTGHS